jgi:cysteinyl-tRNA synthetase
VPYRKQLNFTFDGLKSAATAIDRLHNFKLRLETDHFAEGLDQQLIERTAAANRAFTNSLDDDLNTAEALGNVFEYVRDVNSAMDSGEFRAGNVAAAVAFLRFRFRRAAANYPGGPAFRRRSRNQNRGTYRR